MRVNTQKTLTIQLGMSDNDKQALGTVAAIFIELHELIENETHGQFSLEDFLNNGAYGTDLLDILDDLERNPDRFADFLTDFIQDNYDY